MVNENPEVSVAAMTIEDIEHLSLVESINEARSRPGTQDAM